MTRTPPDDDHHHHAAADASTAPWVPPEVFHQMVRMRRGFGWALAPMDEARASVAIDFSGRPAAVISLGLRREMLGAVACENLEHVFRSFAVAAKAAVHVTVETGDNDHHRAEAAFKAFGLALKQAVQLTGGDVLSAKGTLS